MTQISHVRGIQGVYPDVSKLGKQFKPASQLIKQIAAIRDEARRADMRVQELTAEVEHQRVQHDHARAVALRNSQPEPSPRELHCAERTLKKAQQRSQDARRATEMVERDLRELLAEKGEEYGEFALEFVREADREREELLARLAQVEADASAYRGLYE